MIEMEKKKGEETVYNLEVKELHNFLVGESGVVVHNNYGIFQSIVDGIFDATKKFHSTIVGGAVNEKVCKEFAQKLRDHLSNNGVQSEAWVVRFYSGNTRANKFLVHGNTTVADNGLHVFTVVNDKIYDNVHPYGKAIAEYMDEGFHALYDIKIEKIPFNQSIDSFK